MNTIKFLVTIFSFVFITQSVFSQKNENTIITINGDDTLVIDLNKINGNIDSVIEESLKKFYDITEDKSNKHFEFHFDTVFGNNLDLDFKDFFKLKDNFFNFEIDSSHIRFGDIEIDISDGKMTEKKREKSDENDPYDGFFKIEKDKERRQEQLSNGKKNEISIKKKIEKKFEFPDGNWAGFYFGIGSQLNDNNQFASSDDGEIFAINPLQSFNIHLNPLQKRFSILKDYIGLTTGLGFNWKRYDLLNTGVHILAGAKDSLIITNTGLNYEKSTLRTSYLQIPLMLELQFKNSKSKVWHMNMGVVGKLKLGNSWMYRTSNSRTVVKDDFLFNPFLLSGQVSIGYENVNVFSEIGLTNLFKRTSNYSMRNFSAGIMFSF